MRWLWLCLLFGCAASHLPAGAKMPTPSERASIQAGIDAWKKAELPWTETCQAEITKIRIAVLADKPHEEECRARVNGCMVYRDHGGWWLDPDVVPVLMVFEDTKYDVWKHELIHWLAVCSKLHLGYQDWGDPNHRDKRLWGKEGIEGEMK